ncbi:Rieske (2Fe-2S) protein [Erythrobacter alti]|uniref:Rieske (2Fe-2S) protein n=1 Tax=Erythrobacter alti TaxID=1896145 RepID=UPI0030F373C6
MALEVIASAKVVPPNGTFVVAHGGEQVLLVRTAFGVFAVENRCSHAYQELAEGKVRKIMIFCPLHGLGFDLRNGCPKGNLTDQPIKAWHCEETDEGIAVDLDIRLDPQED